MKKAIFVQMAQSVWLTAILFLFAGYEGVSAQQTPRELAANARPAVVSLTMRNPSDGSTQTGSGFFVGPDIVVTNFHVIAGTIEGHVSVAGRSEKFKVLGTLGVNELADLALLKVENLTGQPLPLAKSNSTVSGDEVFALGGPTVSEGTFSQGTVSGIRRIDDVDLLQITAAVGPGSSGGPVLNNRGEVVGVALGFVEDGQALNFAIPVGLLYELIGRKSALASLSIPTVPSGKSIGRRTIPGTGSSSRSTEFDGIAAGSRSITEFEVNGLKVILKRRPGAATIAGGLFIRGGSRNITDKNAGIETLMLSTAIEAGKALPRSTVRRELASRGSAIAAGASNDYSSISFGTTKPDFARVFDIFSEVLLNPAFAEDDLNRNREQLLTGLRESVVVPEAALDTLQDKVIYAGHPYANSVIGTPATISALTADDLRAYHKRIMETQRLLFVFVGDIDAEQLKAKITSTFGKLPRGNYKDVPYPALDFSKGTFDATQRNVPTNYVKGVFAAPSLDSPDYYAMRVAMSVLQTLVFQEVRGRLQLSYAPDAEMDSLAANTANISASTTDPNRATAAMLEQMNFLKSRQLPQGAIEEIAAFFLTRHYMGQETSGAQVGELAKYELIGGGWRKSFEFLTGVRSVTGADVQRVSDKYMRNIRFAYVGNTSAIDRSIFLK